MCLSLHWLLQLYAHTHIALLDDIPHDVQPELFSDGAALELDPVVVPLHDALGQQQCDGAEAQYR